MPSTGAKVVVGARRIEPLQELAKEIDGTACACDISQEDQIENLTKTALDIYGKIDIAVNSAGVLAWCKISKLSIKQILPTLNISFAGALLFFKHMGNAMAAGEGGSVITISSQTAQLPGPGHAVYAGCRAGIDYAIKVAAYEYGPKKVRFNSIAAGLINTDMTAAHFQGPEVEDVYIKRTPLRRMGTPDDVAGAALWLADEQGSGFVSGQIISVSGGGQNGTLPER